MAEKFAVNDYVIYGKNGLCQISEIKTVHMANTKNEYYVLNSVNGNQVTIYVPCCNEVLMAKMRYPMTKDEIDCLLLSVKGQEIKWIDNNNERNEYFHSITESENYKDWLLLIGCIYLKKQEKLAAGKHLSSHDENTLKLLEKLIEDEFCYSLQLDKNHVSSYIKEKLKIQ
ncbi:MAG: CarD family transcriptional regulator [Oscillospiraceae bacterium]|nr:CarD family transcriptional regulator [Oscillospiraceae bacterium]